MNWRRSLLSGSLFGLAAIVGLVAFTYPFLLPALDPAGTTGMAPLLTAGLLIAALAVLLVDLQGEAIAGSQVAALGVLVALTSMLRFLELAIPGPGGFSPIFGPIILAGFVFGARFGFLMGALTLLVSALITGGVGPWLPYQMFAAGWVGLSAGWLPSWRRPVLWLALFGAVWGLIYGLLMNLYFWPFAVGVGGAYEAGLGIGETLVRYGAFYGATSLLWDLVRAGGNVLTILVLGEPAIRALRRFHARLAYERPPAGARRPEPLPAD